MKGQVQSNLLFTYGTMMSDCYNHGRISAESKKLGAGFTCEPFVMVAKRTHRQIPYVGRVPSVDYDNLHGKETPIFGEVYEIDAPNLWREIDYAEGHPRFYRREIVKVRLTTGVVVECWAYLMDEAFENSESPLSYGEHVPSGNFLNYYDPKVHKEQGHAKTAFYGNFCSNTIRLPRYSRQMSIIDRMERYTKN